MTKRRRAERPPNQGTLSPPPPSHSSPGDRSANAGRSTSRSPIDQPAPARAQPTPARDQPAPARDQVRRLASKSTRTPGVAYPGRPRSPAPASGPAANTSLPNAVTRTHPRYPAYPHTPADPRLRSSRASRAARTKMILLDHLTHPMESRSSARSGRREENLALPDSGPFL